MAASILQSSPCARCRSQCDAPFLTLCSGSYFHPHFTHEETGTAEKWPLRPVPDHTQGPVWSALCPPFQNPLFLTPKFRTFGPTAPITHTGPSSPRAFAQSVLHALPVAGSSYILQVSVEMSLLQRGLPDHTTPKSRPILSPPMPHAPSEALLGWECTSDQRTGLLLIACPGKRAPPASRFQMRSWRTFHTIAQKTVAKYSIVRMCQNLVNESLND